MKAGQLRHRITVYSQSMVSDGCGGQTETFVIKGSCWAEVKTDDPTRQDERYIDRRLKKVNNIAIKTRFNIGFSFEQTDIVFFGQSLYRIQGISNILEHDFRFSVFCYEIENDSVSLIDSGVYDQLGISAFTQQGAAFYNQSGVA